MTHMASTLWLLAVVKSVLAMALVGVVVWSVIAGVSIDDAVLKIILVVLGAYFGVSARYYWYGWSSRKRGDGDG